MLVCTQVSILLCQTIGSIVLEEVYYTDGRVLVLWREIEQRYVRAYRLHWELRHVVRVLEEAAVQTRLVGLVRRRVRAAAHEGGAVQHRLPVRV